MDILLDEELRQFRDAIARWVDERLVPAAQQIDETDEFARDLFVEFRAPGVLRRIARGGLWRGRHETPAFRLHDFCEELARGHMGFASIVCMHASTATMTLALWGHENLRQQYLVPAIAGEKIGAFSITEPNSGSDAASIRTLATPHQGGWRIKGTKMFASNGSIADFVTVAATTDPKLGLKGIKLFFVDKSREGFKVSRKLDKFSIHGADTTELVLDDVFVPDECVLGSEESNFLNAYRALTIDRIFTAALAIGNGRAAYMAALAYAKERTQFSQPIGKFQAVQFRLVDMQAKLEQARLFTYYAAMLADEGMPITAEAALAKLIASENCNELCQKALSVFGGYGLMTEYPAQRYLRNSFFRSLAGARPTSCG